MVRRPVPEPPAPGQESVWDYPRPPSLRRSTEHVQVVLGGVVVADTRESWQVLETSHPPTYYLPATAFTAGAVSPAAGHSYCEWKGVADYLDLHGGDRTAAGAGWFYPQPSPRFAALADHVALYAAAVDACLVDGVAVTPQPGGFYGGWVTPRVAGPFKGIPGSQGW